jgi:hypothetical protein
MIQLETFGCSMVSCVEGRAAQGLVHTSSDINLGTTIESGHFVAIDPRYRRRDYRPLGSASMTLACVSSQHVWTLPDYRSPTINSYLLTIKTSDLPGMNGGVATLATRKELQSGKR